MIFYRIGCIVLILTGLLHLSSHFQEYVPQNDTEKQIVGLMENYKFDFAGATVTMAGIQEGFGLWFSLSLIWTGAMSLFLVKQFRENTAGLRKIAIINTGALAIGALISLIYFFFIPTICITIGLISFGLAALRLK